MSPEETRKSVLLAGPQTGEQDAILRSRKPFLPGSFHVDEI